jgi:lipid-A-disaccharide synthase
MNYYIIAGEESGDLHGSNLIKQLSKLDAQASFRAWGGDKMQDAGAHLVKHINELAFMGFVEVLMNVRTIFKNLSFCKVDLLQNKPDVLILIDYPGFNLRIAEFAHQHGIKVFYYISPQLWAWKSSRVKKIKQYVDEMFVILPFEEDFYKKFDYKVHFVGHPLLDAIENYEVSAKLAIAEEQKPIIALLPGSRKQEIETMLPEMLKVTKQFPDYQFVVAGVKSFGEAKYQQIIAKLPAKVIMGNTYALLAKSKAALVTSGTATLETALFGVPQVVCYKGGYLSYIIARRLVKIKYISLVNLILDKAAVKELIQKDMNATMIAKQLSVLLDSNSPESKTLKQDYQNLKEILGGSGASARTAELMAGMIKDRTGYFSV